MPGNRPSFGGFSRGPAASPRWVFPSGRRVALVVCLVLAEAHLHPSFAEEPPPPSPQGAVSGARSDPYCGLYSLYTVLRLSGIDVDFARLVRPEYVDSRVGSGLAQLNEAAQANGLHAMAVGNLTGSALRRSPYPIILHVKRNMGSKKYNHYELYLGARGDDAVLYDATEGVRSQPFHTLVTRWDGTGLVVSTQPIRTLGLFLPVWERIAVLAVVALSVVIALKWRARRAGTTARTRSWRRRVVLSAVQSGVLIGVALAVGAAYHTYARVGFLSQPETIASVQDAYAATFIPKYGLARVRSLLKGDAVVVDARLRSDFDAGHIDAAISIPVHASDSERHEAIAGVPKDTPIVTYCMSASCPYALRVARALRKDGFENVAVFKGGWWEWKKNNTE